MTPTKEPDTIYVVQVGDAYEDSGKVVYAGTNQNEAKTAAERHLKGSSVVRWSEWDDGICELSKIGTPQLKWEAIDD